MDISTYEDNDDASRGDMAWGVLVAILQAHGGQVTIPAAIMQPEHLGDESGVLHSFAVDPGPEPDTITVRVVPMPRLDADEEPQT